MRAEKLRELGNDELRQKQTELTEASFHLRLRRGTGQLANPMKVSETKRDLARVLTILGERARRERGRS